MAVAPPSCCPLLSSVERRLHSDVTALHDDVTALHRHLDQHHSRLGKRIGSLERKTTTHIASVGEAVDRKVGFQCVGLRKTSFYCIAKNVFVNPLKTQVVEFKLI